MKNAIQKLGLALKDPALRKRILFTLILLVIFRALATIPIPGVDAARLTSFFSQNQFFGLLNIFSGGGLSTLSIVMLGVGPYITASIIMQLLTLMSPRLKAMYQEEGAIGRKKFTQYSRLITVPLALIQSFAFLTLLQNQGVVVPLTFFELVVNILVITTGSVFLMWLCGLMTAFGLGKELSIIIFAGIVASLPTAVNQFVFKYIYPEFDPSILPMAIGILIAGFLVILGVVIITEAERAIPVTYAKRVRGMKMYGGVSTYLPLRLNQSGVIPIIFALSILLFPQMIFNFLAQVNNATIKAISTFVTGILANGWFYAALYFVLVFAFTYFYTAVTFDPKALSTNLQKNGAFIPGVRPGQSTAIHISRILTRLTFVGALFLGIIAVLPIIVRAITGDATFAIGGTALLIVVSVVLDLFKKIDAQISMKEY